MAAIAGRWYTLRSVLLDSSRCHFVLLDNDESCPTADLSNIRPFQWFDRWAVEHAPGLEVSWRLISLCLGLFTVTGLSTFHSYWWLLKSLLKRSVYYTWWFNWRAKCNFHVAAGTLSVVARVSKLGDHLSGKPGNVREFDCQGFY